MIALAAKMPRFRDIRRSTTSWFRPSASIAAKVAEVPSASHRKKIEREIEQLELALKLLLAWPRGDEAPSTKSDEPGTG